MPQNTPVESKVYDKNYFERTDGALYFFKNQTAPKFIRAIQKCGINSGSRVLDIGSGRGDLVFSLARLKADVVGLDYSEDALAISQRAMSHLSKADQAQIKLINGDATQLGFTEKVFDFVFMMDIVEHLYPDQLLLCFQECHRILKDGGKLLIHTSPNRWYNDYGYPCWEQPINKILNTLFKQNLLVRPIRNETDLKVHVNEQTILSLRKILIKADFHSKIWLGPEYVYPERKNSIFHQALEIGRQVICHGFPFSMIPPLSFLFCNDIWAICRK